MSGSASHAVFLSYASQDADVARRICDALREAGVEVWFDQSELVGGDVWDAKIRGQVSTCALFVPIISANTQARLEGYFRLEWKLAANRTQTMAEEKAFLLPVVVDGTSDAEAKVPTEFRAVQWTRLPEGNVTVAFLQRLKQLLLDGDLGRNLPVSSISGTQQQITAGTSDPARQQKRIVAAAWIGVFVVIALAVAAISIARRNPAPESVAREEASAVRTSAPALGEKSVAVLPFVNLSTEKGNEFFADGVHEDVITNLAKIRDLKVIAPASVLAYRDPASRNIKKISSDLGVATLVEASVRRVGSQVHVNARLIDVHTGEHRWAESYDGDVTDQFALQARLAREIAGALKATFTTTERALIERRPTQQPAAHELYLRGLALEENLTTRSSRDKYEQTIGLFEQAIALDPGFALAYARLTRLHGAMFFVALLDPTPARRARAQASVEAAERLAPDAPETRAARATFIYFCENDWKRALTDLRLAERDLPNDTLLLAQIGFCHRRLGQMPEAIRFLERAAALNPHDLRTGAQLTGMLFYSRRFEAALATAQRYLERFPSDNLVREFSLRAQFALDGNRAAFVRMRTALGPLDNDPQGTIAAYAKAMLAGDYVAAERALTDPRFVTVGGLGDAISDPVALHQAQVAFLRGDRAASQAYADAALAYYRERTWTSRQEPFVHLASALLAAYTGRADEAAREARTVLEQVAVLDAFSEAAARQEVARVFAALGQYDAALAVLRELLKGMALASPNEMRHDPLLARMKEDPRFEEILKSAKAL